LIERPPEVKSHKDSGLCINSVLNPGRTSRLRCLDSVSRESGNGGLERREGECEVRDGRIGMGRWKIEGHGRLGLKWESIRDPRDCSNHFKWLLERVEKAYVGSEGFRRTEVASSSEAVIHRDR